jgi:glutathione peroxidase-family protein
MEKPLPLPSFHKRRINGKPAGNEYQPASPGINNFCKRKKTIKWQIKNVLINRINAVVNQYTDSGNVWQLPTVVKYWQAAAGKAVKN